MPHFSEWHKIALTLIVGLFETLQNNSATVMFWLGAIYAVLNIIALIRREFLRRDKDASV